MSTLLCTTLWHWCVLVDCTRCIEYFVQLFEAWTWLVCMLACVRLCVTSQLSQATLNYTKTLKNYRISTELSFEFFCCVLFMARKPSPSNEHHTTQVILMLRYMTYTFLRSVKTQRALSCIHLMSEAKEKASQDLTLWTSFWPNKYKATGIISLDPESITLNSWHGVVWHFVQYGLTPGRLVGTSPSTTHPVVEEIFKHDLMQDPPLIWVFGHFWLFLHHGIEEVERHLLWNFYKKIRRKSWSNVPPKLLACIGFLYKVVHKIGRLWKFNRSHEIEFNFLSAWSISMKFGTLVQHAPGYKTLPQIF